MIAWLLTSHQSPRLKDLLFVTEKALPPKKKKKKKITTE